MDLATKYRFAIEALERIAKFGHADECMSSAPVHECGCYDKSEKEIAEEALERLGEHNRDDALIDEAPPV